MKYLNRPVMYLQRHDFDNSGRIVNPKIPNDKVLIMIQANFCGFCTKAKTAFQELADERKVVCATIQGDGEVEGEKEIMEMIEKICPNFRGYPSYVLYQNGGRVAVHSGGRGKEELEAFTRMRGPRN